MPALDDFQYARWLKSLHRVAQVFLAILLVVALNYLASHHYERFDITKTRQHSLSPETLAHLGRVSEPVHVIVTIPETAADEKVVRYFNDVAALLRRYEHAMRQGSDRRLTVEYVDFFRQRRKAQEIQERHHIVNENVVVFVCGDRRREVRDIDLYDIRDGELTGFRGEQVFTSAILDVSNPQRSKIYVLVGHGEMRLDDVHPARGLSVVADFLRQRNFDLASLDLSSAQQVPADADLILIPGPKAPILPREQELLRQYLSKHNGRMMVFLDLRHPHGLDELLFDWGLRADDMAIMDTGEDFNSSGDLVVRLVSKHPIADYISHHQIPVKLGLTMPVREDPGAPIDETLRLETLMASSESSWAEKNWRAGRNLSYDPDVDLKGPVSLAMIAQRSVGSQLGLHISGGRLVAFGNADFIANSRLSALGNAMLFYNTLQWTIDRDSLLNIPPRPIGKTQIVLSQKDSLRIGTALLVLPALIALFGLAVVWMRRR